MNKNKFECMMGNHTAYEVGASYVSRNDGTLKDVAYVIRCKYCHKLFEYAPFYLNDYNDLKEFKRNTIEYFKNEYLCKAILENGTFACTHFSLYYFRDCDEVTLTDFEKINI